MSVVRTGSNKAGVLFFAELTSVDVVRHRLVSDIVDAYERWDAAQEEQEAQPIRAVPVRGGHPGGHPNRGARRR